MFNHTPSNAGHSSVRFSSSPAAIGLLSVKKKAQGFYVYWAHNTDSFVSYETGVMLPLTKCRSFLPSFQKTLA
jgi:hypothetical protein